MKDTIYNDTWFAEHIWATIGIELITLIIIGALCQLVLKGVFFKIIIKTVEKSKNSWDNAFLDAKLFNRLLLMVPLLIIEFGTQFAPAINLSDPGEVAIIPQTIDTICSALMVFCGILAGLSFTKSINAIYLNREGGAGHPIKGYLQLLNIFICCIGTIFIISILLDEPAWGFISGIGALTAVLMLVFKDTILSVVASIQLSSNNLVRIGDWIEMPQYGADGDVIDIALHTVKVQNWDKTISTIPTHSLIDSSFKNWRGMSDSGSRRIKRSVNVDMGTIHFLTDDEIANLKQFEILDSYLIGKDEELSEHNSNEIKNSDFEANKRRLTNLGTFRHYIKEYLKTKPYIHPDMTFLIRQLAPSKNGVPIEVYIFSNITAWVDYEDIQGDIFDHLLAILPEFGLRAFQDPSGANISDLAIRNS
ncbi:MAG: mechanosensitive ion channel [Planctomycetes bacterium]|nr:mechanosensitive ion channel [Planctomycetota bacterium]